MSNSNTRSTKRLISWQCVGKLLGSQTSGKLFSRRHDKTDAGEPIDQQFVCRNAPLLCDKKIGSVGSLALGWKSLWGPSGETPRFGRTVPHLQLCNLDIQQQLPCQFQVKSGWMRMGRGGCSRRWRWRRRVHRRGDLEDLEAGLEL